MSTVEKIKILDKQKEIIVAETQKIKEKGRWQVNVEEAIRNKFAIIGIVVGSILLLLIIGISKMF